MKEPKKKEQKRKPWGTWHDAKKMEGPKYKGFIEEPEKDDGFYGHYLPAHFKKTKVIDTYGG